MNKICVSIFMLTYNQEEFISQTVESILAQKTSFIYQLVIGEDCSTDDTRLICEKYARENPDKIKLLPSQRNLGLINNFIRTFKECDGKYVAICDGDDYWIDPLKLQKQVDFLESNRDYSIIFTGIKFLYPNGDLHNVNWPDLKETSNFNDLIFSNFIPSVTVLFRNTQDKENFPNWINRFPYGDWPIYLWVTRTGEKIKYLSDVTAVYRKEIGVSEKLKLIPSEIIKVNLGIVDCLYRDPDFICQRTLIKKSLRRHQFSLMAGYFRENKFFKSLRLASELALVSPFKVIRTYLYLIKRK
ncbi:glycosyltransferase [Christiangramia sp. SM2212]|uniref:Glycosyltransferase n=1 Tax=Christiangramia sediminicola TaxID=3073267 RepID=A0ABU1EMT0_9FLAO|nr:glycosyltransferase [Christiangramia sp. SM2212]MDR5589691.1 glycosyltransferase [Christiangramia sp. SM2212]